MVTVNSGGLVNLTTPGVQNDQTHTENVAAITVRFLTCTCSFCGHKRQYRVNFVFT